MNARTSILLTLGSGRTNPTVTSSAQNGPMLLGSSITVGPMDEDANVAGDLYLTETTDDLGTFSLTAERYCFDEVAAALGPALEEGGLAAPR